MVSVFLHHHFKNYSIVISIRYYHYLSKNVIYIISRDTRKRYLINA